MNQENPAISVIIPMYNAEKYIEICLKSILAQTFTDFEIIVVDDCSTDGSCAVVEKYLEEEEQKVKLLRRKENAGVAGIPRNDGLAMARGKYVYFMDADDLLVNVALESLYNAAEEKGAEVVCMPQYLAFKDTSGELLPQKVQIRRYRGELPDVPEFEPEDLATRIDNFVRGKFGVVVWLKFLRRDFLVDNQIFFGNSIVGEDDYWSIEIILRAKKILCVKNAVYIHRMHPESIIRKKRSGNDYAKFLMSPIIDGMKFFTDLRERNDFFKQNPKYFTILTNRYFMSTFNRMLNSFAKSPQIQVYDTILTYLQAESFAEPELIAYLCSIFNMQQRQLILTNQKLAATNQKLVELQKQLAEPPK